MRRLFVIALASLLFAALAPTAKPDVSRLALATVKVTSRAEAGYVANHFDETHNYVPGAVEILLRPGDGVRLRDAGFDYEIVVEDVLSRDLAWAALPKTQVSLPGPDRDDYRRLPDYDAEMRALAKKNPKTVRLFELPNETLEGRTVLGLEIAAGVKRRDGRPVFYVDGLHHAREWPAAEYPMIFAHHLVENLGRDKRVTKIMRRARTVIVPVVNPDGFDYSRESFIDSQGAASTPLAIAGLEAYWRKNRRSASGVTVPEAQKNPDAYGVDVNRNYGFVWGDRKGGSSGTQVDQTYRGSAPFSEPETQNVRGLLSSLNATMVITNHTYGDMVLRPWGDTSKDTPDERALDSIGAGMSKAMGGYRNMKSIGLYPTTGTTQDWTYGALGALSYTFEHGAAFHPPYADSVGQRWKGVIEAFMQGAEAAIAPRYHSIIRGRVVDGSGNPVPATLRLEKKFATPLGEGNPSGQAKLEEVISISSRTTGSGMFKWHVNPSTRPHLVEKKKSEAYRLVVSGPGGKRTFKVTVRRGGTLDLGTIRL